MALELVAGPFQIKTLAGAVITDVIVSTLNSFFDDNLGLCMYRDADHGVYIIQLDGTICLRGLMTNSLGVFIIDLQSQDSFIAPNGIGGYGQVQKSSMTVSRILILPEPPSLAHVRTFDRYLYITVPRIEFKPLSGVGSWTMEAALTYTEAATSIVSAFRTADKNVIGIAYNTGEIVFYDHINKVQLAKHSYTEPCVQLQYSRRHDVYIVVKANKTVVIYSNEVRPSSLSSVVAVTPLTKGHISTIRTRLLGNKNEPCVGELIDWSITGAILKDAQSTTDANGYALNACIVAPTATVSDPIVVTAQVAF